MSAPGPSPGSTTSFVYLNSLDRYSNGQIPRTLSNQTTCVDVTYSLPGLSNIDTAQISSFTFSGNGSVVAGGGQYIRPELYTNIIYLVDYTAGTSNLLTLPAMYSISLSSTLLQKYISASAIGYSSASPNILINSPGSSITTGSTTYDIIGTGPITSCLTWLDQGNTPRHSLGWAPVTTAPDGTNIANRRQLYDLLGLQGHVPSVAGASSTGSNGGYGYSINPVANTAVPGSLWTKYLDVVSPQLQNYTPDLSSSSNYSPPNIIQRFFAGGGGFTNPSFISTLPTAKVMKVVPGSTTLQLKILDDTGVTIPLNFGSIVPGLPLATGTGATAVVGVKSLVLTNVASANTIFATGQQIYLQTISGTAPVLTTIPYLISAVSSTSITVYFNPQSSAITNTTWNYTVSRQGPLNFVGNMTGPEYQMLMVATAKTTTATTS